LIATLHIEEKYPGNYFFPVAVLLAAIRILCKAAIRSNTSPPADNLSICIPLQKEPWNHDLAKA